MKKNIILILFVLLLLGGCKKDEKVRIYTITEKTPAVDVAVTSVSIRGDYWYPSDLKSVTVAYTQNSDYSSASTILAENHNVYGAGDYYYYARLIDLEPGTTYYYYCIFDTGYGSTEGKQWSFTTQSVSATTVTTSSVSNITPTTATCGGEVTSDGGSTVTARGVCWGTSQDPTVSNSHTTDGTGTGSFTSSITGLTENTTYYVRAYATNSAGTSYGEQKIFVTSQSGGGGGTGDHEYVDLGLPSGVLWATCNIGADSPEDYGGYFAWGETTTKSTYDWSTYKWCNGSAYTLTKYNTDPSYGTVDNKTVLDLEDDAAHVNWGDGWRMPTKAEMEELNDKCTWTWTTHNGKKGCRVTGPNGNSIFLPAAGCYLAGSLYRAGSYGLYWSSLCTSYSAYYLDFGSDRVGVYTDHRYGGRSVRPVCPSQSVSAPTVTTSSVSNITQTTATCGGEVTGDGGAAVTARGVCWSTSQNPTVSDSHTADGSGTGSFTSNITGLTANTTYYVRAYATNSAGTSYGEQRTFTTQGGGGTQTTPTVTTSSVSNISQTTATCGGNVTSDGGAAVTARGVCWSTSSNPTVSNSHTTDGSGTGSFTSSITGLTANTTYYVRAYATNSTGTSYGEQKSFTTQSGGGGIIAGHEYVDLGLPSGILWATCNVGADSPEGYGNYYAWGETETKSTYNWGTYKWCNGSHNTLTKYCTDSDYGTVDNKTILDPEDDAAHVNWGGGWRMPTVDDIGELENNCTWTNTTQNGVKGWRYTGPNGNSLFMPCAGAYFDFGFDGAGSYVHRWSSSLSTISPDGALGGIDFEELCCERCEGRSVRPVCPSRK